MNRQLFYELAWILPSVAIPIAMLVAIVVAAFGMQIHVPTDVGIVHAQNLAETPPFNQPGLTQISPGRYRLVLVAQTWLFQPQEVRVPAGAEVEIVATSRDVIHGLTIEGTAVNLMLIPGRIARTVAHFKQAGTYRFVCHEYCGIGHQTMFGKIVVEAP